MRKLIISIVSVFALCGCIPAISVAGECAAPEKTASAAKTGKTEKCPVTGEAVDVKTANYTTTYKGKKYYFCCKDCLTSFKKDPKKYFGKTAKKGTCSIEEQKNK